MAEKPVGKIAPVAVTEMQPPVIGGAAVGTLPKKETPRMPGTRRRPRRNVLEEGEALKMSLQPRMPEQLDPAGLRRMAPCRNGSQTSSTVPVGPPARRP